MISFIPLTIGVLFLGYFFYYFSPTNFFVISYICCVIKLMDTFEAIKLVGLVPKLLSKKEKEKEEEKERVSRERNAEGKRNIIIIITIKDLIFYPRL